MKRYLPFIIIAAVFLAALGIGLALYRSARNPTAPITAANPTPSPLAIENFAPHARGSENASLTLEEYGDYQCPPCGLMYPELKKIETQYSGRMRFIFRHYPLVQAHPHALIAARAAEAAGLQDRFWEMHAKLYENQTQWSNEADPRTSFVNYAREIGLDVNRFVNDLNGQQTEARVVADYRRGRSVGVTGTPTIFVNGRMVRAEATNPEGVRSAIEIVLGQSK